MNSKQKKEVERLRAEVKLAHSEAVKREVELTNAGLDNSAVKVDPTFVDLSDRFWDLCLALECAKGKNPPVQNGREPLGPDPLGREPPWECIVGLCRYLIPDTLHFPVIAYLTKPCSRFWIGLVSIYNIDKTFQSPRVSSLYSGTSIFPNHFSKIRLQGSTFVL